MYMDKVKVGIGNIKFYADEISKRKLDNYDELDYAERLIDRIIREAESTREDILEAYDELED